MTLKILTVLGARPQFVKAAVVSRAFSGHENINEVLVHTGQHYDSNLSDIFFSELGVPPPAYNLGVGSGSHVFQTAEMLRAVETTLLAETADIVLVYGDTNSTLAGALAAAKLNIPVAHVEAGLRSFNRAMPEEINRVIVDRLADYLFAPTRTAVANLRHEGEADDSIFFVGDVMFDAVRLFGARAESEHNIEGRYGLSDGGYILATIHRAENTDSPARLRAIIDGLSRAAGTLPVVLLLHPRTRKAITGLDLDAHATSDLRLMDPVGYIEMSAIEKGAALIVTDSGGVQKEAYFHGVPCITVRDETEWIELVEAGWNRLVPLLTADTLAAAIEETLAAPKKGRPISDFGDGHAAEIVAERLAKLA